jgi:hypothetical protein
MRVTINELIIKLHEAKQLIGGEKEVSFWEDGETDAVFADNFNGSILGKIAGDNSGVHFKIETIKNL